MQTGEPLMKLRWLSRSCIAILALAFASSAHAQLEPRRVEFEVQHTDIQVTLRGADSAFSATATLKVVNIGNTSGTSVTLVVSNLAKVSATRVNGTTVKFNASEDRRFPSLSSVRITPPSPIAVNQPVDVSVDYVLTIQESSPITAINPAESVLLPEAHWYPTINTPLWTKGMDFAPFRLTINTTGERPWAPGKAAGSADYGAASSTTFEMTSKGLPAMITTRPQVVNVEGPADSVVSLDAAIPEGIPGDPKSQVLRILDEARRILHFQADIFGARPAVPIHVVFSPRTGGYGVPGLVILSEDLLHRDFADATMIQDLFGALARNWIGSQVRPLDRGWPIIYDALPRYLAAKYLGQRFGEAAEREAFARFVRAYAPLAGAKKDTFLLAQTFAYSDYSVSMFNKGPLVFRMLERVAGWDLLRAAIKNLVSANAAGTFTIDELKAQLRISENPAVATVFHQWIETITEPDFLVGIPQQQGDRWSVAVRNFGNGDMAVDVLAVTEGGKRLIQPVTLAEANERYQVVTFATAEKIVKTEIDPEKIWVQVNYDNDTRPLRFSVNTLFNQGLAAMRTQGFAEATTKFEQAVEGDPDDAQALVWLGRAQAMAGNTSAAQETMKRALAMTPSLLTVVSWGNITLGDIAAGQKNFAAAADYYSKAISSLDEFPAALLAYGARRRAEQEGGKQLSIDPSIRAFLSKLDSAIMTGVAASVRTLVSNTDLRKFASGIELQKPELWKTDPLRVDALDADRASVEVGLTLKTKAESKSGTAVLLLKRNGSEWLLEKVNYLDVK